MSITVPPAASTMMSMTMTTTTMATTTMPTRLVTAMRTLRDTLTPIRTA